MPLYTYVHHMEWCLVFKDLCNIYKEYSVHMMMRLWRRQSFDGTDDIIALCKIIDEGSRTHYKYYSAIDYQLVLVIFLSIHYRPYYSWKFLIF